MGNYKDMRKLKVSAAYWDSLNAAGQKALCDLAYKYGVQYTKRIITLANKYFPAFTDIAPLSYYKPELPPLFTSGVFIVAVDGEVLGTISKISGIGITERVRRRENGKYTEIWNNWNK